MPIDQYRNFDLRIRRKSRSPRGTYIAEAEGAEHRFKYPFAPLAEENIGLRATARKAVFRRAPDPSRYEKAKEIGAELFRCALSGDVLKAWTERRAIETKNIGLRLRVICAAAPELMALPWEYAWDADRRLHLATSELTPILRCLELPGVGLRALRIRKPLRVLVVSASPRGLPKLQIGKELREVSKGFDVGEVKGNATLRRILKACADAEQEGRPYHVFHFMGHGGFNKQSGQGELFFEDEDGGPVAVNAIRLGSVFHNHPAFRIAFLNACEAGQASERDAFNGVAPGLVKQGLPAVIGMQYEIEDETAVDFAAVFYKNLGNGRPLEGALAAARNELYASDGLEWGIPALYVHPAYNKIFSILKTRPPRPPDPPRGYEPDREPGEGGPLEPESPVRVARKDPEKMLTTIMRALAVGIVVSAPGQFGRSTVLRFIGAIAKDAGKTPVWIDFVVFSPESFSDAGLFFREFARKFAERLPIADADARIRRLWSEPDITNVDRCSKFLQEILRELGDSRVSLLLDGVDQLLGTNVKADFCRLMRVWAGERRFREYPWSRMDMILATSEEAFTLGLNNFTEVRLLPFTDDEVAQLGRCYETRLNRAQLRSLREMVGGHPSLIHLCLAKENEANLKRGEFFAPDREPLATQLAFLRYEIGRYQRESRSEPKVDLEAALAEISQQRQCRDDLAFYLLRALGIVGRSRRPVDFTCPLYRDYFKG